MKKLLLIAAIFCSITLNAQDFTFGDLNYSVNEDGVSVTLTGHVDGTNATGELIIPEVVTYEGNDYAVTRIGEEAFFYYIHLTGDLVIPNSVNYIGKKAFFYCYRITGSLTLSNSLTYIDDEAFSWCHFSGSLNIPNSVTYIGEEAFHGCRYFTGDLIIPESITHISHWAFATCTGFDGTLTIPNTVTYIGQGAFNTCNHLTGSLTIPNSVTYIGDYAFGNCYGFTGSLTIPDSITMIATMAFESCNGLTGKLIIPESVISIGTLAFDNCSGLTGSLIIPNSVINIESSAFAGCTGFCDTLVIGSSVAYISYRVFENCSFSKTISLAETPPMIDELTFENFTCPTLTVPCGCRLAYGNYGYTNSFSAIIEDCVYCWDGAIADAFDGGDGSEENPYQIATPQQLALLAHITNDSVVEPAYYILTDDICLYNDTIQWTPIGFEIYYQAYLKPFSGVFDGNGHCIYDMIIDNPERNLPSGLFGYAENATIKNLQIDCSSIKNNNYTAGLIVARASNSKIENCKTLYSSIAFCQNAGGIVGGIHVFNNDSIYIRNCVNEANLDSIYSGGGIVGYAIAEVDTCVLTIESCINKGNINAKSDSGGISGTANQTIIANCQNFGATNGWNAGGILGSGRDCIVKNCVNNRSGVFDGGEYEAGGIVAVLTHGKLLNCRNFADGSGATIGGIVGVCNGTEIRQCANQGRIWCIGQSCGGIMGERGYQEDMVYIYDCYNRGDIITDIVLTKDTLEYVCEGGILGSGYVSINNVYNTGDFRIIAGMSNVPAYIGNIVGYMHDPLLDLNCYWLYDDEYPACGDPNMPDLPGSSAFRQYISQSCCLLYEPQYGTDDLVEALNAGSNGGCVWVRDTELTNGGFPIWGVVNEFDYPKTGTEWYYEIINDDGSTTYQYLECAADTTIGTTRPKIIIKSNTLYDKDLHIITTHEYVYSQSGIVYWWDKLTGSYTTLYNFNANVGDEWTISVGNQSITMHVDAVNYSEYNGTAYRIMTISDAQNIFSGQIICGIGHTRSFFPEKLLSKNRSYRVDGMRCYWVGGEPIIQFGNVDCDEIYEEHHQTTPPSDNKISVYPNPAYDFILINVKQPTHYTISDIFGKTILKGIISSDNQQVDVSNLENGMYFIKVGEKSVRFIKN